jgi:hypothetical protein
MNKIKIKKKLVATLASENHKGDLEVEVNSHPTTRPWSYRRGHRQAKNGPINPHMR